MWALGLQHLDKQGLGREREMEKQNKVWTVKGKYPSRFIPQVVTVSALCFRSDPSFHISGSRLAGLQTGQRILFFFFFNLLLSQLKAVWDRNHVCFGFHVADNSVSFQNECWSPGIPEHAQKLKRTSGIRWARESCQHENLTQDPNFRGNFGPGDRTLRSQCRGPEFDPWSGN